MIERYNIQFNPDVIRDLKKLDKKIEEEERSENHSPEETTKLKMAKLMRGMMLTNGQNGLRYNGIPY